MFRENKQQCILTRVVKLLRFLRIRNLSFSWIIRLIRRRRPCAIWCCLLAVLSRCWLNISKARCLPTSSSSFLAVKFLVNFLPRCMECRRSLAMRILSVCPSVRHTRELWQNGRKICPDLYIIWKNIYSLVFWEEEWFVGATRTLVPEILGQL